MAGPGRGNGDGKYEESMSSRTLLCSGFVVVIQSKWTIIINCNKFHARIIYIHTSARERACWNRVREGYKGMYKGVQEGVTSWGLGAIDVTYKSFKCNT